MAEIAPLDNRPWIPRPLPSWLSRELARRKDDTGIEYISNAGTSWDEKGNWNAYKGPMTPWVRVCSNGNGKNKALSPFVNKNGSEIVGYPTDGFMLYGGTGFDDTFGIEKNNTILGYQIDGTPHLLPVEKSAGNFNYTVTTSNKKGILNNRTVPMYLPSPGITAVEAMVQKELIRNVTIKWNCYGFAQLEYMTPYFLTPGISMIVEFGWNHFNKDSLLDLRKDEKRSYKVLNAKGEEVDYKIKKDNELINKLTLSDLWQDGTSLYDYNLRISRGMYDVTFGLITNFEFSTQDGIKFDCVTTIGSKHRNFSGVQFNNQNSEDDKEKDTKKQSMTFSDFVEKRLKKVKQCVIRNKNFLEPLDESEKINFAKSKVDPKLFYGGKPEDRVFFGRTDNSANTKMLAAMSAQQGWSPSSQSPTNTPAVATKTDTTYGNNTVPRSDNWDNTSNENIWVTMGFLIELFNYFFTKPSGLIDSSGKQSFEFYKIKSDNVIVGAHPNLISTDGTILLIPNAKSPKYNNGVIYVTKSDEYDEQKFNDKLDNKENFQGKFRSFTEINEKIQSSKKNPNVKSSIYDYSDNALFKTFGTGYSKETGNSNVTAGNTITITNVYQQQAPSPSPSPLDGEKPSVKSITGIVRDDLDYILNNIYYGKNKTEIGKHSFPKYESNGGYEEGRYGNLEDIYVNTDHIIKIVKESKNTGEFYDRLLQSMNDAVAGFWDLRIVHGDDFLSFADQKFFSPKHFEGVEVFQFDMSSGRNIIKNLSFTSTISNVQANQVIASSNNNQGGANESSTSAPLDFAFGDRLFDGKFKRQKHIDNSETIKQLQTYGPKSDQFIMTFVDSKEAKNIVNLALPNKALLSSILDDKDFENNTNVYGGQQPNFTLEMTLEGIAGFRTYQCFSFKNFPRPYSDDEVIFQIVDVTHNVTHNNWETKIKAGIRPFRSRIKPVYIDGSNL